MDRKLVDLGDCVAILEEVPMADDQGTGLVMTIMYPGSDTDGPSVVQVFDQDGLRNLAASLHEALDEVDAKSS